MDKKHFSISELGKFCSQNKAHENPLKLNTPEDGPGEGILFEPLPGFYFGMCQNLHVQRSIYMPLHADIPFFTAHLVLDGTCDYALSTSPNYTNAHTILFQKNSYLLGYWKNSYFKIHSPEQKSYTYITLYIQEDTLRSYLGDTSVQFLKDKMTNLSTESGIQKTFTHLLTPKILTMAQYFFDENLDNNLLTFRSKALELLTNIFSEAPLCKKDIPLCIYEYDKKRAREMKLYIEENFLDIPSVKNICTKYALSLSKADKLFKSVYSTTMAQYIHQCKMAHAHNLLSNLKCNVSECAHEIGYSNISHFIAAFKKCYAVTPKSVSLHATSINK